MAGRNSSSDGRPTDQDSRNGGGERAPVGRPSKYDPAYCDEIIELGRQGYSVVEMADHFDVSRLTLETNWTEAHPEFLAAFTRARQASQAWWEKQGRVSLDKPVFQASLYSRSMAARFPADWREKTAHEHTGKDGGPIQTENRTETVGAIAAALRANKAGGATE